MSACSAAESWHFLHLSWFVTAAHIFGPGTGCNKAANFPQNHEDVKEYRGREGEKESAMIQQQ